MRSRYSAFVLHLKDYLLRSWHTSTRPAELDLSQSPNWQSLRVISTSQNGDFAQVSFRAVYRTDNRWGYLQEVSDFTREQGNWRYLNGIPQEGILKPGRNGPCPCGSGRKFKVCCGR